MRITSINTFPVNPIRPTSLNFSKIKDPLNNISFLKPAFDTVVFKGAPKQFPPFYAVKIDGTERRKFKSPTEASFALRIERAGIVYCLEGGNRTKDYFIIKADEVEDTKEDGSTELNEEKFQIAFNKKKDKTPPDTPVYVVAIDRSKINRYDGINQAAQGLSTGRAAILNCLNGKIRMTSHCFVLDAKSVEKPSKDGKMELDEEKFEIEFQKRLAILKENSPSHTPVYIARIDDIKAIKRFDDINFAATFISTSRDNVVTV